MRKPDNLRAALYARVSSDRQAEAGTIASQVAALRQRISQDEIPIEEELFFIDDGYTGTSLVRPALEKLRDMAAMRTLDRLYVHSPDRLARKYAYQVLLLDEFQRYGVQIVFLNHAIGETPEDQLLLQVQGMVAEYERAKLLERCRRGKLHRARQGCVNALAAAPYGYRYVRKADGDGVARFDVLLEEARVVRRIFAWVGNERLSLGEVCRRLQNQGIRTRTGNERWDRSTICDMLKNPAYHGSAVYGRTCVGPRRPRLRPPRGQAEQPRQPHSVYATDSPGIIIAVPALVSRDLFDAVAEQLEENRKRHRQSRRGARWLLQGLVVCSKCGYAHYGVGTRHRLANGETVVHAYYRCVGRNGHRFGGRPLCDNRQIPVGDLDGAVWRDVCDLLRNPGKVRVEYERRLDASEGQPIPVEAEQAAKQIHKVKQAIGRLIDAYQEGLLEKAEFEPRLKAAKDRLQRLEAETRHDAEQQTQRQDLRLALQGLADFASQVESGLAEADWHARRDIIRALVKRIEIGGEEVRIVYRVSPPPFEKGPDGGTFEHCGRLLEPALPNVPAAAVARAITMRLRGEQPLHPKTQVAVLVWPEHQMKVVGHCTIPDQPHRHAGAGCTQQRDKPVVVVVIMEHARPIVTAVDDVVAITARRGS
jgi:site-specific DNA recombinase